MTVTATDEVGATDTDAPNADVARAAITAPVANPRAGRKGQRAERRATRA